MSFINNKFIVANTNIMPKQNTALLLSRYIWLLDTIYSAGYITRDEINRRWSRSQISEGETEISERTFHRYKDAIQELFQIDIAFSKTRGYYIENSTDFQRNEMRKWLISTFAVNNLINEGVNLRKHIAFEPMPSGQQYLTSILEAIRERVRLRVTHRGFSKPEPKTFTIAPFCLKVFKQRWYVLAQSEYEDGRVLVYSLDRFLEVSRTDIKYEIPADFDVDEYFSAFYGVSCVNGIKAELVRLKVDAWQAKYFRSLPLHPSQQEMETTDEYSIFEYFLVPTFELSKEILSNGPAVEVLAPQSLRNEIANKIGEMRAKYELK